MYPISIPMIAEINITNFSDCKNQSLICWNFKAGKQALTDAILQLFFTNYL